MIEPFYLSGMYNKYLRPYVENIKEHGLQGAVCISKGYMKGSKIWRKVISITILLWTVK